MTSAPCFVFRLAAIGKKRYHGRMFKLSRFFPVAAALLLSGCSWFGQQLQSDSGLYDVPLQHHYKVALDGFYIGSGAGQVPLPERGTICVTPMNVDLVQESSGAEYLPVMQQHMLGYLQSELSAALQEFFPNGEWAVTVDASAATVRVDTALVRFRPQNPGLRVGATVAGSFIPVPLVSRGVKAFAKGDICIEGAVRLCSDNTLLYAFKDSNRETAALYMAEAYERTGNAELSLRVWAKKLARLIYASAYARLNGDDVRRMIEERSLIDTAEAYAE